MQDMNPEVERLREQDAGNYVAWLDDTVILSAETYDDLCDRLNEMPSEIEARAGVEFVRPTDVVSLP
jgi:hypothetical protein